MVPLTTISSLLLFLRKLNDPAVVSFILLSILSILLKWPSANLSKISLVFAPCSNTYIFYYRQSRRRSTENVWGKKGHRINRIEQIWIWHFTTSIVLRIQFCIVLAPHPSPPWTKNTSLWGCSVLDSLATPVFSGLINSVLGHLLDSAEKRQGLAGQVPLEVHFDDPKFQSDWWKTKGPAIVARSFLKAFENPPAVTVCAYSINVLIAAKFRRINMMSEWQKTPTLWLWRDSDMKGVT